MGAHDTPINFFGVCGGGEFIVIRDRKTIDPRTPIIQCRDGGQTVFPPPDRQLPETRGATHPTLGVQQILRNF